MKKGQVADRFGLGRSVEIFDGYFRIHSSRWGLAEYFGYLGYYIFFGDREYGVLYLKYPMLSGIKKMLGSGQVSGTCWALI